MTTPSKPRWSAHILATYLTQRTGLTQQQLDWEIQQWLGVNEPGVRIEPGTDSTAIITARYRLKMLPGGQVVSFQLLPSARRPQLVIKPQQRRKKSQRQAAPAPQQPRDNSSQIVQQIQAEATARQPRVFVKKKKTMEPH